MYISFDDQRGVYGVRGGMFVSNKMCVTNMDINMFQFFFFFSLPSTLTKHTLNNILIENTININSFFISSKDIYYNEKNV